MASLQQTSALAVLTDRMLIQYVLSFLPGLPHVLLTFEQEAYASLPEHEKNDLRSRGRYSAEGLWLRHALMTKRFQVDEMLFRFRRQRYYASLPMFSVARILEQISLVGTTDHLLALTRHADFPSIWPSDLMSQFAKSFSLTMEFKIDTQRLKEQVGIVYWLTEYHPEVCHVKIPLSGSRLCDTRLQELLAAFLRSGVIIIDETANGISLPVAKLIASICPDQVNAAMVNVCARQSQLDVLEWLHHHPQFTDAGIFTTSAMDDAAAWGMLQVIRFLHASRAEGCTTAAMDNAAASGCLETVRFLHENRREGCTRRAMENAIVHNHVHIARYLLGQGLNLSEQIYSRPLNEAGVFVRNYLERHSFPEASREAAIYETVKQGKLEDLMRLHLSCSPQLCAWMLRAAIQSNRAAIARHLIEHCAIARESLGADMLGLALALDREDTIDTGFVAFLVANCTGNFRTKDARLLEFAVRRESLDVLKLLVDAGVPCSPQVLSLAIARHSDAQMIEYLIETFPNCIISSTLFDAWYGGYERIFVQLHERFPNLCDRFFKLTSFHFRCSSWAMLKYMHQHCRHGKTTDRSLDEAWRFASVDGILFLCLADPSPAVSRSLERAARAHKLRVFSVLQQFAPAMFSTDADKPWCYQLRLLRQRVEAASLSVDEVETALALLGCQRPGDLKTPDPSTDFFTMLPTCDA